MDKYSFLNAAHTAYFAELYDQYLQQPDSLEPSWRAFFQGFDFGMENSATETVEKYLSIYIEKNSIKQKKSKFRILYSPELKEEVIEFYELLLNPTTKAILLVLLKSNLALSQIELVATIEKSNPSISRGLKVLLENLLRYEDDLSVTKNQIVAIKDWLKTKTSKTEIAYRPTRVLLQDYTGIPAVADLAAMREAVKEAKPDFKGKDVTERRKASWKDKAGGTGGRKNAIKNRYGFGFTPISSDINTMPGGGVKGSGNMSTTTGRSQGGVCTQAKALAGKCN